MCVEEDLFHSVVERGVLGMEVWVYTKLVKVQSHALLEEVKSVWRDVKAVPFFGNTEGWRGICWQRTH